MADINKLRPILRNKNPDTGAMETTRGVYNDKIYDIVDGKVKYNKEETYNNFTSPEAKKRIAIEGYTNPDAQPKKGTQANHAVTSTDRKTGKAK